MEAVFLEHAKTVQVSLALVLASLTHRVSHTNNSLATYKQFISGDMGSG